MQANEILAVVNSKKEKLLIIGVHRPLAFQLGYREIVQTGDFNTRNILWDDELDINLTGQDLNFHQTLTQFGLT